MNHDDLLLFTLLILISLTAPPTIHATPTLTVFPASVVANANSAASYIVTLSGGTANASYALAVAGLPTESVYSFSSTLIGPGGSSILTVQTSIATPLYCPGNYHFIVTATNTLLSSDSASAAGSLGVTQVGPPIALSISTDKSAYSVGEPVTISIVTSRPAEGTLTISPPSGSPNSYKFGYSSPPFKTLTATLPAGVWTVRLVADDYCNGSDAAITHFDVLPSTISMTNTTATTITLAVTSSSTTSSVSITLTSATSTITSTSFTIQTGTATVINALTITTTTRRTALILTTLPQESITSTVVISNVQNPPLEVALGFVLTISLLAIALTRRPRYGRALTCSKCGFQNPTTVSSFCIRCGQPLKRRGSA